MSRVHAIVSALFGLAAAETAVAPAAPVAGTISGPVNVTSDNAPSGQQYERDAGWLGTVGSRVFVMNFDTSLCNADETTNCTFIGTNSFADATTVAAVVTDPPEAVNLCNTDDQLGWVTNVWGVNDTHGIGFFLNITHDTTTGEELNQGSSPVIFDVSEDTPVCTRINDAVDFWTADANHATYGNGGSLTALDGYMYIYANQNNVMYLARVPFNVDDASDLSSYTYWNGDDFVADESEAVGIMDVLGGSIFYSNFLEKYVWLSEGLGYSGIYAYVSDLPQGPFSNGTLLFTDPSRGGTYAPFAMTNYDATGATVKIVYSVVDNLSQRVRTVTWN
ncbi:hypothetical protein M406DRAFT_67819 [Cryphonectria parasitica EP155]|uniref:DUF4185 domain-containing protein n=1 Tax=Cryphonectria parasitica (strain ATCC 38755 / EP155) TaxID=660469 RepID=A0A9P5CNE1_CRYP1|nr:uncharacterized protein M406DRAFT_67819 [Cryphonectria parasitica EP155]KAF3765364.1 hypothetical protein M406DRAFT_67819 [Cryphonectria parasitica EP155]